MDPARASTCHNQRTRLVVGSEGHHSLLLANRAARNPCVSTSPRTPHRGRIATRHKCDTPMPGVSPGSAKEVTPHVRRTPDRAARPARDHPPTCPATRAVPCTSATARRQRKPTSCHHHDEPTPAQRTEYVMSTALAVVADDATLRRLADDPDTQLSPVARLVLRYADTWRHGPAPISKIASQLCIGTAAAESAAAELARHGLAQTVQVAA